MLYPMFAAYQPCALIVDADAAVRVSAAMLLSVLRVDSHLAENANAALALVEQRFFDFALIDLGLPDMDGALLAEKLRYIAPAMSIIIVSAVQDPLVRQGSSAAYWLDKPMSSKLLQQAIREILTAGASPTAMEAEVRSFT
jgi:CheY-like chemotaxis protein